MHFRIIHQITFIKKYYNIFYTYLLTQHYMFFSLWHGSIWSRHYQNSSIHFSSPCNHIFYVILMSRTIYMSIVFFIGNIFNCRVINGYSSIFFFWRFINRRIIVKNIIMFLRHYFWYRRSKSCFSMINMTYCSNVNVRFISDIFWKRSHSIFS